MITQTLKLNLIPGQVLPRVNVSQYDYGSRTLEFKLFNGNQSFTLTSSMTANISGTKADMHGFDYDATVDTTNQKIVADLTQQMTAAAGDVTCELIIKKSGERLGTCNFVISVEKAALGDDAIISDTELPVIIAEATAQMEAAAASASSAANSATAAAGSASAAASSETNAAASETAASGSATAAANSATAAAGSASAAASSETNAATSERAAASSETNAAASETAASGSATAAAKSASAAATSASNAATSETHAATSATTAANAATSATNSASSAATSAQEAEDSAERAAAYSVNVPYIGANGNWWVWNTTQEAYVDTGVDASITVDIEDITMLAPDATPYVTNTGTDTDPVFHLFIPRGKGISGISKTSTSGLVDTYTITYSDGTTTTFTVTNGKTAYQSAVEGGYTKTEAEFESDLAHFEEWKDDAETAADNAADSKTDAAQSALDAANSASLAEQYADFVTPHFIIANNRLYIKDDAVGEFVVANNRLYIKLAS